MRRRRRRGGDGGITLFPFLAVLICTMGSLIVLLVVVVQQAKANAATVSRQRETQRDTQLQQVKQLQERKAEFSWRIEVLESSRQQTAEQLKDRRRVLSHLENEIRLLSEALDAAIDEAERIAQQESDQVAKQTASEQEVDALRRRLERAEEDLDLARDALSKRKPSYSIVPYDGPHGTERRPIFVECTGDRVIIQPEGIELYGVDFQQPITDDNPLAAALRAKREYFARTFRRQDNHPYPLLIVRPDGAQAYAAARTAMKSWDAEFGYELVDSDLNLKYPKRDPALVAIVHDAVEEARFQRQHLKSIAPARFGRQRSTTLTASRNGGFVQDGAGRDRGRDRPSIGEGSGRPNPYGAPGGTGLGNPGSGNRPGGQPLHGFGAPGPISSNRATATALGNQKNGSGDLANLTASSGRFGAAEPGGSEGGSGGPSGGTGQSGFGGNGTADAGNVLRPYDPDGREMAGDDSSLSSQAGGGSFEGGTSPNGQSQLGRGNSVKNGSRSSTGARLSSAADGAGSSGDAATGGSGASSGGQGPSFGSPGQPNAGPGSMSVGASTMSSPTMQPIANARGADWGLPTGSQGSVGITRPIPVVLTGRYLEILPEDRRGKPVRLDVQGSLRSQMDKLVSTLWSRMDNWGIAGANMYWKPVLSVRVHASGEQRYQELSRLLQDSGIVVQRKN